MSKKRRRRRSRRKKMTAGRVVSNILLIVSLAVFVFAAYRLYDIFHEYNKGDKGYELLEQYADIDGDTEDFYVDFDSLLKQNGDLIGWIRIDDPIKISYPVMQSEDNSYYLRRVFDKSYNILGSIFMDYRCSSDLTDLHTIIYGHNTKNGSMFGGLKKWQEKKEYEENPYFYIYTPDGIEHQYEICSVMVTDASAEDYDLDFVDVKDFAAWEEYIQSNALYNTEVKLDSDSKIVTLSTCTNRTEDERLVVHGIEINTKECKK